MGETKEIVEGVSAATFPGGEGIWVSHPDGKHTIGLVEEKSVGGYLAIYKDQTGDTLPLAVTADGVQLPRASECNEYRFIRWDDLYAVVQAYKATKPA